MTKVFCDICGEPVVEPVNKTFQTESKVPADPPVIISVDLSFRMAVGGGRVDICSSCVTTVLGELSGKPSKRVTKSK